MITSLTCDQLKTQLADAENAYHVLNLGGATTSVRYADKTLTFTPANLAQLTRYIGELRGKIAACTGETYTRRRILRITPSDGF